MADFDGWQTIGPPLGEGGQGKVFRARSPIRAAAVKDSEQQISDALRQINGGNFTMTYAQLSKLIVDVGGPDELKDLGALKVFKIEGDGPKREKAYGRLDKEVDALSSINHPAVLKLLYFNRHKDFIVTEFHPLGTLNAHLNKYAGRALEALLAFKPLVEGVVRIHAEGAIHRDIKTENIFVASYGRLVLGDFGIVFFADERRTRLTDVLGERVGSHFWMAPWAYEPVRLPIDEIKPTLDIFPLGKVLWSMIAGRDGPVYWEYDRPGNNLETMFPEDPSMRYVNKVLSRCIVREEEACVKTAEGLLILVDEAIDNITHLDRRTRNAAEWQCLVCKKGHYGGDKVGWRPNDFVDIKENNKVHVGDLTGYFCDYCGHVQFFKPKWVPSGT